MDDGADYKVTRRVGKAAVLPTAPAFSFAGRFDKTPADPGPGPGQYGSSLPGGKSTSFGTSTRMARQAYPSPAGTDYKVKADPVLRSKPAYSFGGKPLPESSRHQTPGPGAYDSARGTKLTKPSHGGITLSHRTEGDREAERKPAPGAYDPNYRDKEVHAASMKFRNPVPSSLHGAPGPGEYKLHSPRTEGRTFGVSRDYRHLDNGVPGPGFYGVPDDEGVRKQRASWSIGKAPRDGRPHTSAGPGPGQYPVGQSAASDHRSAPAFTFGGRSISARPGLSPGPSDYGVPGNPGARHKPAYSIRGAAWEDRREKVPGPGAYAVRDSVVRRSAPAISISWRQEEPGAKDLKPGPGSYDVKDDDKRLAVSLKFRNPNPNDFDNNPAPHDYADKDFRGFGHDCSCVCSGCKRGFSMGQRLGEKQADTMPGPIYRVGVSTLGVGAEPELLKSKLDLTVVL